MLVGIFDGWSDLRRSCNLGNLDERCSQLKYAHDQYCFLPSYMMPFMHQFEICPISLNRWKQKAEREVGMNQFALSRLWRSLPPYASLSGDVVITTPSLLFDGLLPTNIGFNIFLKFPEARARHGRKWINQCFSSSFYSYSSLSYLLGGRLIS